MGCVSASGPFGPKPLVDLTDLEERESDDDVLEENEFPYMTGRLKEINW